ncbi:TPA: DNA mismatch endonuclease Vsr, partial [Candidatus Bathyarchaeota archaeon]|nr:DNA mismatch endonuclease Vsr [Candidatus Bathyarchaeota archaeon]
MPKRISLPTTSKRSQLMKKIRQKNTVEEIRVQNYLDSLGIIYETHSKDLPGSPDVLNKEEKWAIFINGCFWHAHDCRKRKPVNNAEYWLEKLEKNKLRDAKKISELKQRGYNVLVLWGCEIKHGEMENKVNSFFNPIMEDFVVNEKTGIVSRIIKSGTKILSQVDLPFKNQTEPLNARNLFDYCYLRLQNRIPPSNDDRIYCVDLFSGCGGLSLGAYDACIALGKQFQGLVALDSDEDSLKLYKKNLPVIEAIQNEIENILDGELGSPPTESERKFLLKTKGTNLFLA